MAISLYDVSAGTYLQMLAGLSNVLAKGKVHFAEKGLNPDDIMDVRLAPDMLPLRVQAMMVEHQSLGALESLKSGIFAPAAKQSPADYAAMQKLIADAHAALEAIKTADIDALADRDVLFQAGDIKLPFTATNFILCFSLPNFYFHITTIYAILRANGVPLGKRDYMGAPRFKV